MDSYRFVLEKYTGMGSRYTCPGCGAEKKFTRYVDTLTGNHVHPLVGRCDREVNCGYHLTPKRYFEMHPDEHQDGTFKIKSVPPAPPPSFHDPENMKLSLARYDENNFVKYLHTLFAPGKVQEVVSKYHVGTSKHCSGGTVFWQVDKGSKVHAGKIILYDPVTGHRDKSRHVTWVHSVSKIEEFTLDQCFFGTHLIGDLPIGIVESEKTAVIASVYLPQFTWIATGAKGMLSLERCKPLQGHKVVLFPDLGAFDDWKKVADKLHFGISDLLERYATKEERQSGFDLADYLVRFDISQFEKQESPIAPRRECAQTQISTVCKVAPKAEIWDMASLESCFSTLQLPKEIRLNDYTTIFDTKQFVSHHLEILKTNDGNPTYKPYKDRLIELIYQINKN